MSLRAWVQSSVLQGKRKKEQRQTMFSLAWGQGQELCVLRDLVEIRHLHLAELPVLAQTSSSSVPQMSPYGREKAEPLSP